MHVIIERKSCPLLGDRKRAEKIVSWSMASKPGTRLLAKRGTGLSLEVVARDTTPQVYIYFNADKLRTKLKELPEKSFFHTVSDGFSIYILNGGVEIKLISLPKKLSSIWKGTLKEASPYDILLGMIELGEDAFRFYTTSECPARPELCGPLEVLGRDNESRQPRKLSAQSKRFLLKDAVLNELLRKKCPSSVGVKMVEDRK